LAFANHFFICYVYSFIAALRKLLHIFCYLTALTVSAQKEAAIWYFGDKAGLDFGGGTPINLAPSAMNTPEGSASISDKDGVLLFYTNGEVIWNRKHEIMDNGTGLNGNTSSTQSSLIVPHPGNDSLYYVFCVDYHGGSKGITYSIVNIKPNNGLGRVTQKNRILAGLTTEKITAVLHCNNKDVWVTVRLWKSNFFYSFLINKNGLDPDPVISSTPNNLDGQEWGTLGSMKISPNSTRIAAAHGWSVNYIELGNFNRLTGEITNTIRLSVSPPGYSGFETGPYGVEFSPDSRFLYVYCAYGGSKSQIYQFDLNNPTVADIMNSRQLITELNYAYAGSLQLGPDQKIYVTNSFDSSLSVINQPNNPFPLCDFQFAQHKLNSKCALGLPNFIPTYFDPNYAPSDFSSTGCSTRNINFQLRSFSDVVSARWNFGDPGSGANNTSTSLAPSHVYPANGFYDVTLILTRSCSIDTVRKRVYAGNLPVDLPPTGSGCNGDSLFLSVPFYADVKYRWSTGSRSNTTSITTSGRYWVTATAGCVFTDSTDISFFDKPVFNLGPDQIVCTGQQILLDPGIAGMGYQWSNGASSQAINVNAIGSYWLTMTNSANCSWSDTILIMDKPFPPVYLGNDTLICETEQLTLSPKISQAGLNYLWQDGSKGTKITVKQSGVYHVQVSDNCTVKRDTILVSFKTCPMGVPNAFSPNGDRTNEVFRAKYGVGVIKYLMRIYNRFGQMVYETSDQLKGWDGTLNGKPQPMGTYVWTVQYTEKDSGRQINLKGMVTLVR